MSAHPDSSTSAPAVTALAGDGEFSIFEVVAFDGKVLQVCTPFALGLGEEIPLNIERIGRTNGRVTGHRRDGDRAITELTLFESPVE
jgi:hypothetical protein